MQRPFEKLKGLPLRTAAAQPKPEAAEEKLAPPVTDLPEDLSDDELFRWAMQDVAPREWSSSREVPLPEKPGGPLRDEDREAYQELRALVDGSSPFDFSQSDEYIERAVTPSAKPLLRKLRRGQYSVQAVLDLHGMDRDEARRSVENFVLRAVGLRHGCVKIIHGRGHNSKENRAVLKELLQLWLATRRMSRYVLAYTSARPNDGGAGAVYVLLRKPPPPRPSRGTSK